MTTNPETLSARAIVVGESLVDIVIDTGGHKRSHPGGSPMNVAVGLGRLGIPTTLVTRIGADDFGAEILAHLAAAAVDLWPGSITNEPTSTAIATLDATGAASYEFDLLWSIPRPAIKQATLIHTGSIGAILEPGATEVRATFAAADPSTLLSFDPNIRPGIMGEHAKVIEAVEALTRLTHVIKMSDEDAAWLYPELSHSDIALNFERFGVSLFVITRGEHGCFIRANGIELELPAPRVDVIDTIGAGDAFMSGLLYAIISTNLLTSVIKRELRSTEVDQIIRIALASAAITVSRAGATPPNVEELNEAVKRGVGQ
ncbi:MAG TPA: carbohydrate kinase [Arthrobacter bacterium]|nr:carbohydrate kinase [Arthrobacter sp.]